MLLKGSLLLRGVLLVLGPLERSPTLVLDLQMMNTGASWTVICAGLSSSFHLAATPPPSQ